jgi:hypothetical protein
VTFIPPNIDEDGNEIESENSSPTDSKKDKSKPQCRFCWGTESTEENPCIVPCNCSGSVGFIHYNCLKNWISLKMQRKEHESITTLFWRNFECELCKYAYPYAFKTTKKVYKLVDIKVPQTSPNYLVMESLPLEKNSSRTIHVLSFLQDSQVFSMGRGHESQVRVNDISVSRMHAKIKFKDDKIYILDNKSKFGTLLLMRESCKRLKQGDNYMF